MTRLAAFLFLLLFACPAVAGECPTLHSSQAPFAKILKRGINLSSWWQDAAQKAVSPAEMKNLRRMGFDFVRLPVSDRWLEKDGAEQAGILVRLQCDVNALLKHGFHVILDLHPGARFNEELNDMGEEDALQRLAGIWRKLATATRGFPSQLMLQLYNEPPFPPKDWWRVQGRLIKEVRKFAPQRKLIAMAAMHDGMTELAGMVPYAEKNVAYDFHFYIPMYFTHHGAEWTTRYRDREAVTYPATAKDSADSEAAQSYNAYGWNRAKLSGFLNNVRNWKAHYGKQVMCLEFGVYRRHTDPQSRANWLRDMREMLEAAHIPWALWEYRGGFGLFGTDEIDQDMAKALRLQYGDGR